eukprot:1885393-Amphidinium_carterae.4
MGMFVYTRVPCKELPPETLAMTGCGIRARPAEALVEADVLATSELQKVLATCTATQSTALQQVRSSMNSSGASVDGVSELLSTESNDHCSTEGCLGLEAKLEQRRGCGDPRPRQGMAFSDSVQVLLMLLLCDSLCQP